MNIALRCLTFLLYDAVDYYVQSPINSLLLYIVLYIVLYIAFL